MSEFEETYEKIEEDDMNMLGVDNDDFEIHFDKEQGFHTPYDDNKDANASYFQYM